MAMSFPIRGSMFAVLCVAAICALAPARAADDLGPPVGSKIDFGTLNDADAKPKTMAQLMGKNGMVLFFFRSAEWCPFCQAQLMDLQSGYSEIEKRGYSLAGISYDTPEKQKAFIEKRGIGFTLLSDPKSEIIDRYGLRDPQYKEGSKAYGVPRPIIFILGKDGAIKAKLYEETYKTRPPVGLVIETLDKVAAGKP